MMKTWVRCPHCNEQVGFLDWQMDMPIGYFDCPFCFRCMGVKPSKTERVEIELMGTTFGMIYDPVKDTLRITK